MEATEWRLPDWAMQMLYTPLQRKSIACWCPLPEEEKLDICHAATLLEMVRSCGQRART
jgi:Domain of unknown function (DUF4326)